MVKEGVRAGWSLEGASEPLLPDPPPTIAGEGMSLGERPHPPSAPTPCPPPQVRLTLLQLKGLEDSYEGSVAFPTGTFTIKPLGFL